MFRKKKMVGCVTIFNDNDITAADRFNDLGIDDMDDTENAGTDQLDNLTREQVTRLAVANAQAGREATRRALAMAAETRDIGAKTTETLGAQTAQLEKMGDDFDAVHGYLDQSEKVIEKMRKPKLIRMLQGKGWRSNGGTSSANVSVISSSPGNAKDEYYKDLKRNGCHSVKYSQEAQKYGTRKAGIVSMGDIEGDGGSSDDDGDSDVDKSASFKLSAGSFNIGKLMKGGKKGKGEGNVVISTRKIHDDYEEFDPEVGDILKEQDEDLDLISDSLTDMKRMAVAMNNELQYQGHLVNSIQDATVSASERTKRNVNEMSKIK